MTDIVALAQVGLALVNIIVIPAMLGAGRWLWRVERRLIKIETKLNIED